MASFARWCYRHRVIVVIAWLVVLFSVVGIERAVGSAYSNTFTLPGTESSRALSSADRGPAQAGRRLRHHRLARAQRVGQRPGACRRASQALLQKVAAVPSVAAVRSPYGPGGAAQISQDGKTAYATVDFNEQAQSLPEADVRHVIDLVKARRHSVPAGRDRRAGHRAGQPDAALQQRGHRPHRRGDHHPARLRLAPRHGAAADRRRGGARHGDLRHRSLLAPHERHRSSLRRWPRSSGSASASTTRCSSSPATATG